jgi:glycosyltransferase involved in cell wall biosynthesis
LQQNISPVSLSVVIPAYNEEKRLPATLERVSSYFAGRCDGVRLRDWEILVVDDGSRDGTSTVVDQWSRKDGHLRLIRNPGNRGKGYAVRNGMRSAQGEWRLFSDADLSAPIEEVEKLLSAALEQGADVAIGSRAVDRSLVEVHQSAFREASGRFFNRIMRLATGLPFLDTQCGFKLYSAKAAEAVFSRQLLEGFSFDVEDLVIAKHLGMKCLEIPVRWANVEGTKVSAWSGAKSFADLVTIRMNALRGRYS